MGFWKDPHAVTEEEKSKIRSMHEDYEEAEVSLERLKALERRDEFMVLVAHDCRIHRTGREHRREYIDRLSSFSFLKYCMGHR